MMLPFVASGPGAPEVALALAVAAAEHWALPPPVLMRTGMNALFAAGDDVVLRVGRPTADPAAAVWLGEWLAGHGIRAPRMARHGVFLEQPERPEQQVFGGLAVHAMVRERASGSIDWAEVGSMVAQLHRLDPAEVAGCYPTPWCSSFPWWDFDVLLSDVASDLDPPALSGIERALARHRGWRDGVDEVVLCHGDVHPGNVIPTEAGPVLIDWDLMCLGPASWDHAPLMTWTDRWGGEAGVYEAFADGYGRSLRGDQVAEALAELRLVAATLMRVRAGRTDSGAAEEAEQRLRWWRGDRDAPMWRAA